MKKYYLKTICLLLLLAYLTFLKACLQQQEKPKKIKLIKKSQAMSMKDWIRDIGNSKTILSQLNEKKELEVFSCRDISIWFYNNILFIAFKKDGKLYNNPHKFIFSFPSNAASESNYKLEQEVESFNEIKKILLNRNEGFLLDVPPKNSSEDKSK